MAPLDDVDGVDLDIAQVLDGALDRLWSVAERLRRIEPLGVQPDPPRLDFG